MCGSVQRSLPPYFPRADGSSSCISARRLIVSLYGTAGPLVVILLWAFYSAQLLLLGAEFTAVYASECGSRLVAADDAVAVGEPAKSNEAEQHSIQRQRTAITRQCRSQSKRGQALID